MPVLNWIGKDKVIDHDKELPFRVLKPVNELSIGKNNQNLLIEGDNLEALKALMPFYYNKVKCIYIDPPYNTGNEKWNYNDKVNSPVMRRWLNKVVGSDDLERHDKWLCMMYPRLKLLKALLADDGVILVSINDYENSNLLFLLNEIFEEKNYLTTFIWNTEGNIDNSSQVKTNHEYIHAYCKNKNQFKSPRVIDPNIEESSKLFNAEIKNTITKNGSKNPPSKVVLPIGFPADIENGTIHKNQHEYPKLFEDVGVKNYKITNQVIVESGWSSKNLLMLFIQNDFQPIIDSQGKETIFKITKTGAIYTYKKRLETQHHVLSVLKNLGTTQQSSRVLASLGLNFDYPKPIGLIKYLVSVFTPEKEGIIMDSFAGSGTTGHAVLELNQEDGGNRNFILVELEQEIAKKITAQRLTKIIKGYESSLFPSGTGQGFKYLDLNGLLYDYSGYVNHDAKYEDMAAYIYFTETKDYLDLSKIKNPYIGSQESTHLFLFFKEKDKNILDEKALRETESYKGSKIIYADKCLIEEDKLAKQGVVFKQIPYELKKY